MIDIKTYAEKLEIALQQKQNDNYKKAIQAELAKSEWQERKFEIEKQLTGIKEFNDFEKYQKALSRLFDDLYEVITAPGVDDFIGWLNGITDNKNEANTKKLRKFLVDHFSDSSISDLIESVLSVKDSLWTEKSVFNTLLLGIIRHIKTYCNEFLNKPAEFENNVDDFLTYLDNLLSGISGITQFKFTSKDQLFNEDQVTRNIIFYDELIDTIIEKNQSLKPLNESEETQDLLLILNNRVKGIIDCIDILDKSNVAHRKDQFLERIFFKFKDEMIKYEGGMKDNLDLFLEKNWTLMESNYNDINLFFSETISVEIKDEWKSFPKNEGIGSIILNYQAIIKDNPISSLLSLSSLDIQKILANKSDQIQKFQANSLAIKEEVLDEFIKRIKEYDEHKIPQLESILKKDTRIRETFDNLKEQVDGLKNGIKVLDKQSNFLKYLIESFTEHLLCYFQIRELFKKALQESGRKEQIEWLEEKFKSSETVNLTEADFNNPDLIKELISIGLIKVSIHQLG